MKSFKQKTYILFLLIIFLAIFLRFPFLDRIPPSIYTDEANQGYNAYSILRTAKDEHGVFLPVSLRSFGDWKPPVPTYLMVPFIAVMGLNPLAIRMPSALLGVGTVLILYYLVKELLLESGFSTTKLALLSSFFLTISPWHILQSRAAMLVVVSLFFLELAVYLFIKSTKKPGYLLISTISFVLSIYSYYGMRLITPLFIVYLLFTNYKKLFLIKREFYFSVFIFILLLLPLLVSYFKNPNVLFGRAKTVSVFYDRGVKLRQWELISQDGNLTKTWISRLFHNNVYMYGRDITRRFLLHFDLRFLLLEGDQASPFQIPKMGILYLLDVIFVSIGIFILFKSKFNNQKLIILWLFISVIPAALTFMTPSSNRTFNMVIPLMILVALGLVHINKFLRNKMMLLLIFSALYGVSLVFYLNRWFIQLPFNYSHFWSYEWNELGKYLIQVEKKYSNIYIFDNEGMGYIYILFHQKYDPALFQKEVIRTYVSDRFGFEHVENFGKYIFLEGEKWPDFKDSLSSDSLYVVPAKVTEKENEYLNSINFPDGKIAFKIFSRK